MPESPEDPDSDAPQGETRHESFAEFWNRIKKEVAGLKTKAAG